MIHANDNVDDDDDKHECMCVTDEWNISASHRGQPMPDDNLNSNITYKLWCGDAWSGRLLLPNTGTCILWLSEYKSWIDVIWIPYWAHHIPSDDRLITQGDRMNHHEGDQWYLIRQTEENNRDLIHSKTRSKHTSKTGQITVPWRRKSNITLGNHSGSTES